MREIYIVCQTPSCQQTYNIDSLNICSPKDRVFCSECNGIVIDENGRGNISGLSDVRPVVGNTLLSCLYKNGELYSMKLKTTSYGTACWNIEDTSLSLTQFMTDVHRAIRMCKRVELTQHSVDDIMFNKRDLIDKLLEYDIITSRNNILSRKI